MAAAMKGSPVQLHGGTKRHQAEWGGCVGVGGVDHPDQYRVVHRHTARSLLSPTRLIHNPQPTRPFLLLQPAQETLDSIADKDFQNLLYFSQDSYASWKMQVHDGLSWKIGILFQNFSTCSKIEFLFQVKDKKC